jgi:uncharacterized Zn finger protein (UPF0148 family)
MSILDANGAIACAECGRLSRAVHDRLAAENAKLQDENARLRSCLSDDADNARQIMAESAKLRELVRDYERCTMHADCSMCEYDGKLSTHCPLSPCFPDADELRELGIEVD